MPAGIEIAREYLRRGWSVVPIYRSSKKPMVEWLEFTKRRPTVPEVEEWWGKWPDANIALITGEISGLIVVDVDVDRGGDPRAAIKAGPTELISKTGSGGFHLFYAYPKGEKKVRNRVGSDGLDIRADGGYVVLPPSLHQNGNRYTWVREGAPGPFPRSYGAETKSDTPKSERWLETLLTGVSKGGRNNACARLAGYLASKAIPEDVCLAFIAQWNTKNNPPMPEQELVQTVKSVYRSAILRLSKQVTPVFVDDTEQSKEQEPPKPEWSALHFDQYLAKYALGDTRWCVKDWLPDGTIAFVIAPPGSFKTWMVFDLLQSVAMGSPFLGKYPVESPGPVLLIQQEDHHQDIGERMSTILGARQNWIMEANGEVFTITVPKAPPIYVHPDRSFRFDNIESVQGLAKFIEKIRPKVVVIDPLYSTASLDDYLAGATEKMWVLKKLRDKYGCSFVLVHHTKKGGSNGREGAWGSQFLNAFLETGWQIRVREDDDAHQIRVQRHFKRAGKQPALRLTFEIETPSANNTSSYNVSIENMEEKSVVEAVLEEYGPLSVAQMCKVLNLSRRTVKRRLDDCLSKGRIEARGDKFALTATMATTLPLNIEGTF